MFLVSSTKRRMALKIKEGEKNGVRVFWGSELVEDIQSCTDVEAYAAAQELEKEGAIRFVKADGTSVRQFMVRATEELPIWLSKTEFINYLAKEILEFLYRSWSKDGLESVRIALIENALYEHESSRLRRARESLKSKGLIVTVDAPGEGDTVKLTQSGITWVEGSEEDGRELRMGDNYNFRNVTNSNVAVNSPSVKQAIIGSQTLTRDQISLGLRNTLSGICELGLPPDIESKIYKVLETAIESLDDSDPEYALQSVRRVLKLTSSFDKEKQQILKLLGPVAEG